RANSDNSWIVATASEQQQDRNDWSSTLFKPEVVQSQPDNQKLLYRFRHRRWKPSRDFTRPIRVTYGFKRLVAYAKCNRVPCESGIF
ncbi:unnamed protein product, partial [Prunus brigantina]